MYNCDVSAGGGFPQPFVGVGIDGADPTGPISTAWNLQSVPNQPAGVQSIEFGAAAGLTAGWHTFALWIKNQSLATFSFTNPWMTVWAF
jgi:hypothetical protein